MTGRPLAVFLGVALAASLAASPAVAAKTKIPRGKTWVLDFRSDTLGIAPPGTVVMGGTWAVMEDSVAAAAAAAGAPGDSARAPVRFLRQQAGDDAVAASWIQFKKPMLETCDVSVRFRVVSGELDPGVGILFHYDPKRKNGYLVRLSGKTGEVIAHYLISGRRRDITMKDFDLPAAGEWHTLGIRREGVRIDVLYDGNKVMSLRDERYPKGVVGLWTEDDTVADFADFTITAR